MAAPARCKACSKRVYVMDQQLSLPDGATFHKSCFRCRHCSASLHPSNFSASPLDGALYCNPHFHLLFSHHHNKLDDKADSNSNSISKANDTNNTTTSIPLISPSTAPSTKPLAADEITPAAAAAPTRAPSAPAPAPAPAPAFTRSPSKAAMMFSGTQDKCVVCTKTVYPLEKVTVEGQAYHKSCFRCSHGGCAISPSNYAALEGVLYCKHHFKQLFKEKGSYNHIMKSASIKRAAISTQSHPRPEHESQPIASSAPDA